MVDLCSNLEVKRPTAQHFIELLEATHLIYRLAPYGYGKDVLRARFKIYLADAAIAPAVMLKGKAILEDAAALGVATETAVFKHLFARYYAQNVRFSYWRGKREHDAHSTDRGHPFQTDRGQRSRGSRTPWVVCLSDGQDGRATVRHRFGTLSAISLERGLPGCPRGALAPGEQPGAEGSLDGVGGGCSSLVHGGGGAQRR